MTHDVIGWVKHVQAIREGLADGAGFRRVLVDLIKSAQIDRQWIRSTMEMFQRLLEDTKP
jgi:hypothetical protein